MRVGRHKIEISHKEKIFFPQAGLSKGDLIDYYRHVAPKILPHTRRYPASMQRFPDGLNGPDFYCKDTPDYFPSWIKTVNFPKRENGSFSAPLIDKEATLVYLADQAMITPHLYLAPAKNLNRPDKMIFDLDPPENSLDFTAVRRAALDIMNFMHELGLKTWVQTTGSKGFHVLVPLDGKSGFREVRNFARNTAKTMVRRKPNAYTLEYRKSKRKGRIFMDIMRNSYGATAVAPYAVRARHQATVATPIEWEELKNGASPRDWTMESIPGRLKDKKDPWKGIMRHGQSIKKRRYKLRKLMDREKPAQEEQD